MQLCFFSPFKQKVTPSVRSLKDLMGTQLSLISELKCMIVSSEDQSVRHYQVSAVPVLVSEVKGHPGGTLAEADREEVVRRNHMT